MTNLFVVLLVAMMLSGVIAGFWAVFSMASAAVECMRETAVILLREGTKESPECLLRASDLPDSGLRPAGGFGVDALLRAGSASSLD